MKTRQQIMDLIASENFAAATELNEARKAVLAANGLEELKETFERQAKAEAVFVAMDRLKRAAEANDIITVGTDGYFGVHLQTPRGYGLWWFELKNAPSGAVDFQYTGTYFEAKKAALKEAGRVGATMIEVKP